MIGDAVQVRSARLSRPVFMMVLGVVLVIVAILFAVFEPVDNLRIELPSLVVGIVFLILSGFFWWSELNRRAWLEVTPTGFCYRDRNGEQTIEDKQILSVALHVRRNFANGLLDSVTRFFTVWVAVDEDEPKQIKMVNSLEVDEVDPLADFIKRISDRLLDQARKSLRSGDKLIGEQWSLDKSALHLSAPRQKSMDLRVADLTAVEAVDEQICFWVLGQAEAIAKVPIKSRNAHVLLRLLESHLKKHKTEATEPEDGNLGRILFERHYPLWNAAALVLFAVGCGIASLVLFYLGFSDAVLLLVGLGTLFVAVAFLIGASYMLVAFFRCHEWGVHQKGLFSEKQLRYGEVESFTYHGVRKFYNGAYMGSTFTLVFDPQPEQKSNRISYSATIKNVDAELENLRDHISRIIAVKMLQQFKQAKTVRWTENLCYLPAGLEYRPAGWVGRKEAEVLPYGEIAHYKIEEGTFSLWAAERDKPVVTESASAPNFFPGLTVLMLITNRKENLSTPLS